MNVKYSIMSSIFLVSMIAAEYQPAPDEQLIDTISVAIYTEDGTDIITKSEIDRPGLDGSSRSIDDQVFERLIYKDAKKFKIMPDAEMVDKHLKAVQRENNLTLDQLKDIFKAAGYTYEEGREQFAMVTTINSVLDFKVRSRLVVPERELKEYYDAHPLKLPAACLLERAVVPFDPEMSPEELRSRLMAFARSGRGFDDVSWSNPFWVEIADLAEEKQAIADLEVGEVSAPFELEDGFELFRVKEKRLDALVSLEDRYREISDALRRPRYEKLMNDYKQSLFDSASIVYF